MGKTNRRTLVDTGPLVAILRHGDSRHDDCRAIFASYTEPLITCWPVVTETVWLVRHHPAAVKTFLSFFEAQILAVLSLQDGSPSWFCQFFDTYAPWKPDFADAALVYLAEREAIDTIFTLDRRGFSNYRDREGRPFRLLP